MIHYCIFSVLQLKVDAVLPKVAILLIDGYSVILSFGKVNVYRRHGVALDIERDSLCPFCPIAICKIEGRSNFSCIAISHCLVKEMERINAFMVVYCITSLECYLLVPQERYNYRAIIRRCNLKMDSEYQSAEFQCYTIGSCRVEVVQLTRVCLHAWGICSVWRVKADSS